MTAAPNPSSSDTAKAIDRIAAQFEALRNAYRGYLPWGSDSTDVKTRLLQIEDMDKAFFAAIADLRSSPTPEIAGGVREVLDELRRDTKKLARELQQGLPKRNAAERLEAISAALQSSTPAVTG